MRGGFFKIQQFDILRLLWKMDAPQRLAQREKLIFPAQVERQRFFGGFGELIHDLLHHFPHFFLVQPFCQGVDRHDAPGVQQFRVRVGLVENLVFRLNHFQPAVAFQRDFAAQHHPRSGREDFFQKRLIEPFRGKDAGVVADHQFENFGMLFRRDGHAARAHDAVNRGRLVAWAQPGDFFDAAAIFVTARKAE